MNSTYINNKNISNIQHQIEKKKHYKPYHATIEETTSVLTDFDTFPYPRWYRGISTSYKPIVIEREAGWRQRHDNCYKLSNFTCKPASKPKHCFSSACSVVFPCFSEDINKYGEFFDVSLKEKSVLEYR